MQELLRESVEFFVGTLIDHAANNVITRDTEGEYVAYQPDQCAIYDMSALANLYATQLSYEIQAGHVDCVLRMFAGIQTQYEMIGAMEAQRAADFAYALRYAAHLEESIG